MIRGRQKSGPRATARPATHYIRTARDKLVGPRAGLVLNYNVIIIFNEISNRIQLLMNRIDEKPFVCVCVAVNKLTVTGVGAVEGLMSRKDLKDLKELEDLWMAAYFRCCCCCCCLNRRLGPGLCPLKINSQSNFLLFIHRNNSLELNSIKFD